MMFFMILGWGILVLLALGLTLCLPWLMLFMSAYGGSKPEDKWAALVPFALGCLALYGLFTHSPFHIVVS